MLHFGGYYVPCVPVAPMAMGRPYIISFPKCDDEPKFGARNYVWKITDSNKNN